MRRIWAVALVGLILAGCGSKDSNTAEAALRRQLDMMSKGQYSRVYDELHPAQQAFISRDLYVKCSDTSGLVNLVSVKVMETYPENSLIPGTDVHADSTAITAELKVGLRTMKTTMHEFPVDGGWRFTVRDGDSFRAGKCP